jgi:hydroxypyruvate reductase
VHEALERAPVPAPIVALAVGKAAQAMARGAGEVARGLCITNVDDGAPMPPRWRVLVGAHPLPDDRSVAAGLAALALVEGAGGADTVLALISGGASALLEVPTPGASLATIQRTTRELMARGVPIGELNAARTELSAIKGGRLADRALVDVVTLAISDVIGDDPRVIGSGPTVRPGDRVEVIGPMSAFGEQVASLLSTHRLDARLVAEPVAGDVTDVAAALAATSGRAVAWGEPTVRLPPSPGRGGRATQLALLLARHFRGTPRSAFVAASDGLDGASDAAGAYIDGTTWSALTSAGVDPERELAACNAAAALDRIGALFEPGPTGINHADVVIVD